MSRRYPVHTPDKFRPKVHSIHTIRRCTFHIHPTHIVPVHTIGMPPMLDHHGGTHSRSPTPSLPTHSSEGKDDLLVRFCCIRCSFRNQWYQESESSIWVSRAREGAHPWLSLGLWNYDWVSRITTLELWLSVTNPGFDIMTFRPLFPHCVYAWQKIFSEWSFRCFGYPKLNVGILAIQCT
jgi:hypothetical protein